MNESEQNRLNQDIAILQHPHSHTKPEFVYAYYDYCRLNIESAKVSLVSDKYPSDVKLVLGTRWKISFNDVEAVLNGNYVMISEEQMRDDLSAVLRDYIFTAFVSKIAMELGLTYDNIRVWFDTTVSDVIPDEYVDKFYRAVVDIVKR